MEQVKFSVYAYRALLGEKIKALEKVVHKAKKRGDKAALALAYYSLGLIYDEKNIFCV